MFYDNLKAICDNKGLKITPIVAECGGAKGSITNWRNGAIPNSDIVIRLAERLGVTTDSLLLGSDKCTLSKEQEELLFSILPGGQSLPDLPQFYRQEVQSGFQDSSQKLLWAGCSQNLDICLYRDHRFQ